MTGPRSLTRRVKVLIVDDSPAVTKGLTLLVGSDPELEVVHSTTDPTTAAEAVGRLRPDVIVMDWDMPVMDGGHLTERVMRECPTPILIVSATGRNATKGALQFKALQAGAIDLFPKEDLVRAWRVDAIREAFLAKVKFVARCPVRRHPPLQSTAKSAALFLDVSTPQPTSHFKIVAIAASTGGPAALDVVLRGMGTLPTPVVIVQHMAAEFVDDMVRWLISTTGQSIEIVRFGTKLWPGIVYIAGGGSHVMIGSNLCARLDDGEAVHSCRPSADRLFESLAQSLGSDGIGVVLTGMGEDGAAGLKAMRNAGAVTIVQDEPSCVVFGMPAAAIKLGAQTMVLPLQEIGETITRLVHGEVR